MKLTTFILVISLMQVTAATFGQNVTLKKNNISIAKLFYEIRKQTGYDILVKDKNFKTDKLIDASFINVPLNDVMTELFKGTDLTFTIADRTVVIREKAKGQPVPVTVNGFIKNQANEALVGATVTNKRTEKRTSTNKDGYFTLVDVEAADSLTVRYIGYKAKTVVVGKVPYLTIKMEEATSGLDEVVVQGYGRTTQRLTTGSISRVTAAEIEKQPVNDLLLTLTGRVPGLNITPQSGFEGGPLKVEIRGRNSIRSNFASDPLYVIDGVPVTVLDVGGTAFNADASRGNNFSRGIDQTGLSYSNGQSPLYNINPLDIESIEVLKDGDATAIYGSRGANGVILITTKRGKPGTNNLSVRVENGVTYVTRTLPQLNTQDYLTMRREAFRNDGLVPNRQNAPDLFGPNVNNYTDWQKFAYGNAGNRFNAYGTLSGGSEQTNFLLSAGYNTVKAITDAPSNVNQGASVSFNVTNTSNNKRLNVNFSGGFSFSEQNQVSLQGITNLPPNAPPPYDENGAPNFLGYYQAGMGYPFSALYKPYNSLSNMIKGSMLLSYTIIKGLNAKVNLGYNSSQNNAKRTEPIASFSPYGRLVPATGTVSFGDTRISNVSVEPQLTYNRVISKGTLDLLVGGTIQDNRTSGLTNTGQGYQSDAFIGSIQLAPTKNVLDNVGQYKYAGVFGRINYVWDNKYILNINGRRDGSSRFGPGSQFGNFGSLGLAWIVSDEKFYQSFMPKAVSFFKLRASYGITGSDAIGDYQYLPQYGSATGINGSPLTTYNAQLALVPQLMANPDYRWQQNKKMDLALSMEMFDGAFGFEANYYRNRCDNQLVQIPLPDFTGFNAVTANHPANVQNSGVEFQLRVMPFKGGKVSWNNSFNISFNHNKLLDYPDLASSANRNQYKIGGSLNNEYVVRFTGVDPLTGKYTYEDYNGDGFIKSPTNVFPGTQTSDAYLVIDRTPKFSGGYTTSLSYKNLSLTMVFSFAKQIQASFISTGLSQAGGSMANIPQFVFDGRWSYPGQTDAVFRGMSTGTLGALTSNSDANFEDASYLRFQTVSMQYRLPDNLLKGIGIRGIAINVNTNNLFVISSYRGLDPQVYSGVQPPVRTIQFGLSASF